MVGGDAEPGDDHEQQHEPVARRGRRERDPDPGKSDPGRQQPERAAAIRPGAEERLDERRRGRRGEHHDRGERVREPEAVDHERQQRRQRAVREVGRAVSQRERRHRPLVDLRPHRSETSCGKPVARSGVAPMAGTAPEADDCESMTKILIVGGGVAALEAALALQELAPELAEVELVAPDSSFAYRPLLVTGDARTFPLQRLTDDAGASLRQGTVTRVDAEQSRRAHRRRRGAVVRPVAARARRHSDRCAARCVVLPRPGRCGRARADGRGRARGRDRKLRLRRSKRRQVGAAALRARAAHAERGSSTPARSASGSPS